MGRKVAAVVAGYVVWTVVFLGAGLGLRTAFSGLHDSDGFTESTGLLVAYLVVSFAASVLGGLACARIASGRAVLLALGVCLLATGVPVQLGAGDAVPMWYNVIFLLALIPMTLVGGKLGSGAATPSG